MGTRIIFFCHGQVCPCDMEKRDDGEKEVLCCSAIVQG